MSSENVKHPEDKFCVAKATVIVIKQMLPDILIHHTRSLESILIDRDRKQIRKSHLCNSWKVSKLIWQIFV